MSSSKEYDQIAGQYSNSTTTRDDRLAVLLPSAKFYLGNLSGKSVLDLACGDGFFTRHIKKWGADKVIGVDISKEMIALARSMESKNSQEIEYYVEDVANLSDFGKFDVVFAGFLLHYSPNRKVLRQMTRKVSESLRTSGLFVTFNENPDKPIHEGIRYGVETIASDLVSDGSKVKRVHYKDKKKDFEFSHFHYSKSTYEETMKKEGLKAIKWQPFVLDENITNDCYWGDYLNDFSITVLTAERE